MRSAPRRRHGLPRPPRPPRPPRRPEPRDSSHVSPAPRRPGPNSERLAGPPEHRCGIDARLSPPSGHRCGNDVRRRTALPHRCHRCSAQANIDVATMVTCDSTHDLRPEPLPEGGFREVHQVGCRGLDFEPATSSSRRRGGPVLLSVAGRRCPALWPVGARLSRPVRRSVPEPVMNPMTCGNASDGGWW